MFQVTSSETMKCPSKEIDKNNISLLLPKTTISQIVSLKSQHSLCLFLLVVLSCVCVCGFFCFFFCFFFFCSPWRSDVFCGGTSEIAEEHSGLSSEIRSCPLLLSQAERLHDRSLPLRHWALTCTHIVTPTLSCFVPTCRSLCFITV